MKAIPIENTNADKNPAIVLEPFNSSYVFLNGEFVTLRLNVLSFVAYLKIA